MSMITYMRRARAQSTIWATRSTSISLNLPRVGSRTLHEIGSRSELKPNAAIASRSALHRGGYLLAGLRSGQRPSAYAERSIGYSGAVPGPNSSRLAGVAPCRSTIRPCSSAM